MKRVLLALAILVCLPWHSWAQDDPAAADIFALVDASGIGDNGGSFFDTICGVTINTPNTSREVGQLGLELHYDVETWVVFNACVTHVKVAGRVELVSYTARAGEGFFSSAAVFDGGMNAPGKYHIIGAHNYGVSITSLS